MSDEGGEGPEKKSRVRAGCASSRMLQLNAKGRGAKEDDELRGEFEARVTARAPRDRGKEIKENREYLIKP
jgi:hypothetical protein